MKGFSSMKRLLILLTSCIIMSMVFVMPVSAMESTSYTYTIAPEGYYIRTQDAYIPGEVFMKDIGLNKPEDLFIKDGNLFIADTGNSRIVKYNMVSGKTTYLGEGLLSAPTGICAGRDGKIYVADFGKSEIIILAADGSVLKSIKRPSDQIYGNKSIFKPKKVAVDSFGNIYAVSEGTFEGILQFDDKGEFNGFFGANQSGKLSVFERIRDLIFTEEQKAKLFFRNPPNIVNLDAGNDDLIYSVTQMEDNNSIKKLNMAGINIFARRDRLWGEKFFVDTAVTKTGEIYAITDTGSVTEYNSEGYLVFAFGGRAVSSDRNGLTSVVSALDIDDDYNIYILDKERGAVQTYYQTEFASMTHQAMQTFYNGLYDKSELLWKEVLRFNPIQSFAHYGYGKALFQMGKYKESLEHFKFCYDQPDYSLSYWEIRGEWLRNNLYGILIGIICLSIVIVVLKLISKKYDIFSGISTIWRSAKGKSRLLSDLTYTFHMLRHPIDSLYDLKKSIHGSVLSASILYILAFVVWMMDSIFRAFIFNKFNFGPWANPMVLSITVIVPAVLYVIGNYLISSINNGIGTFKNVYTAIAYSFSPYIIFTPLLTIVSFMLTANEVFIINISEAVILIYTGVLVFLAAKETHDYDIKETIKNILLTIVFIILSVLTILIMYMLWNELYKFIVDIAEEVAYRVFS